MEREAYAAARTVAPKVLAYFENRRFKALAKGGAALAPLPNEETVEALIDTAFWASLRREEGYPPKISLAFLSPEDTIHPYSFERPLPFTPAALTRVAPAVERPGIHLGVSQGPAGLHVWGTTRIIPNLCMVLEVTAPGLLVVKHHGGETSKFANVAVLQGEQIKLVDELASHVPDCPALVSSLLGFGSLASWAHSSSVLAQLAVSMRAHGHGGCVLVVPSGGSTWRESIVQMLYAASAPFSVLTEDDEAAISWVAGLTAVDGAAMISDRYEVLGFGAKIGRRRGYEHISQVVSTEPIVDAVPEVVDPERLGGTRHLSAAQFVHDQRDAMALVASQDGRFTIFEWSGCEGMVHSHHVETLLL